MKERRENEKDDMEDKERRKSIRKRAKILGEVEDNGSKGDNEANCSSFPPSALHIT